MLNSKILTFGYLELPQREVENKQIVKKVAIPFIPIRISRGDRLSLPFRALVDSGATRSLFPAAFGIRLGINITEGKLVKIFGIGDKEITAYTHKIKLHLGLITFNTEVDFSFEQDIPLLGRDGFFNLFQKVTFDEHFYQVQLILKTES